MKILCIDDNSALGASLKDYLGKNWRVYLATTGAAGLELANDISFDSIILDLGLPDISGQNVCLRLRRAGIDTPILVLSGSSEPTTKADLLNYGADDYVTKPFDIGELQARLLALMRRGKLGADAEASLLRAGELTLNPVKRQVKRGDTAIALRRKEFDILEYLLRNQGKVVSRSMIMDNVWESDTDSWNNTIDVHIKYLRDKVDKPFGDKLIQTAYGVGYTISDSV